MTAKDLSDVPRPDVTRRSTRRLLPRSVFQVFRYCYRHIQTFPAIIYSNDLPSRKNPTRASTSAWHASPKKIRRRLLTLLPNLSFTKLSVLNGHELHANFAYRDLLRDIAHSSCSDSSTMDLLKRLPMPTLRRTL
jgi:hypothetical protein